MRWTRAPWDEGRNCLSHCGCAHARCRNGWVEKSWRSNISCLMSNTKCGLEFPWDRSAPTACRGGNRLDHEEVWSARRLGIWTRWHSFVPTTRSFLCYKATHTHRHHNVRRGSSAVVVDITPAPWSDVNKLRDMFFWRDSRAHSLHFRFWKAGWGRCWFIRFFVNH